jgi:hypothetical protein
MTAEYIDPFQSMNARLVKGNRRRFRRFITSNPSSSWIQKNVTDTTL